MKLAEALMLRADIQKDLAWCKTQMVKGALVQEGERPGEDPNELVQRVEDRSAQLEALITRINEVNLVSRDGAGRSLTQLMARRDMLRLKHGIYSDAHSEATDRQSRYGASEIKWKASFGAVEMRKRIEAIAAELRSLNVTIQQMNWSVEIG